MYFNRRVGIQCTSGNGSSGTQEQGKTSEETTNYEISKTTETQLTEAGGVKRLSVAVVLDGTYTTDASGNSVYAPREQAQLDQITALVKSAMGFDQSRGDQLQVANLFDTRHIAMPRDEFLAVPDRICVGGGPDKIAAIRAMLRGGYANILVTDEATARSLLDA